MGAFSMAFTCSCGEGGGWPVVPGDEALQPLSRLIEETMHTIAAVTFNSFTCKYLMNVPSIEIGAASVPHAKQRAKAAPLGLPMNGASTRNSY